MSRRKLYGFAHTVAADPIFLDVPEITIVDRHSTKKRTFSISALQSHPTLAKAFLSAFYRHSQTRAFSALNTRWQLLKLFFTFLSVEGAPDSVDSINEDLFDRYVPWLRQYRGKDGKSRISTKSAYNTYQFAEILAQDVLHTRKRHLRKRQNPFPGVGRASLPKEHCEPAGFINLLACAKRDVRELWGQWSLRDRIDPDSPLATSIAYLQEKHAGIAIPNLAVTMRRTTPLQWQAIERAGGFDFVVRHVHATMDTLTPLLILIGYYTAANVEALEAFARDCMSPDPILEKTFKLSWWKGRSSYEQTATRSDFGLFSAPSLIRFVLELTAPLVIHAPPHEANRLFLVPIDGRQGRIGAPTYQMWYSAVKRFIKRHNILNEDGTPLHFRRDMIRPTVIADVLRKTRSPMIAKRVANHRNIQTTWQYVVEPLTNELLDSVIATAQTVLLGNLTRKPQPVSDKNKEDGMPKFGMAYGRANDCKDPLDGTGGAKAGDLCPAWLHPFNDPGLVVPPEPKYVAEVLRHRDALVAIREFTLQEKFQRVYQPALSIIDNKILTRMPKQVLKEARQLAKSLPQLPVFADE